MALGLTPHQIIEKGIHPQLVIADEWERVELKKIASVQNGYAFSSKLFNRTEGMPLIRIRDIFSVETENLYLGEYKEDFVVNKGDILIGMDGDFKVSKWPGNKGLLNQRVCRIHFDSNHYDKEFLFICIQPYLNAIHSETSAVTVKHLSSRTINDIPFPLPPLPEQRAIVAKIEELFSDLDQGIADLKKAQDQLKVYRQAVLKKAFEGDWEKVSLETISEAIGGNAFKSKTFLKEKGKYQVIRIGNIRPGIIRYGASPIYINDVDDKTLNKYLLKKGDLIITLTGTRNKRDYGFTALVETENLLLNQRLAYLRFHEGCLPKFYLYFSWSEPFKVQFFGSETGNVGQGNVGMKSVRQTLVPKLSEDKQLQIVQEIESRLSVCDKVEQSISDSLEKAKALRQSILKKAFEGTLLSEEEIAVCKAAPDYEPASVLLEKIKAEKKKK
jgi:type I restriction enzyme, S subunit